MAGRPDKQNADYFSHDNSMRNDKKLKAVRARFDLRGYAVYNMILESLSEADLLMIRNDELEIEMMAGDFGIESEELNKLLDYFKKIKLLKITKNLIFCPQLDGRLKPIFDKRNKDLLQLRVNYCKINSINVTEIHNDSTEKHRVKESKVKESKEEESMGHELQKLVSDKYPNVAKLKSQLKTDEAEWLYDNYEMEDIIEYLNQMENWQLLTRKNSVYLTIRSWLKRSNISKKKVYIPVKEREEKELKPGVDY